MKAEEWIDPLFPSAVLVSYLNELPSSLLPPDMYEKFIGICGKVLKFLTINRGKVIIYYSCTFEPMLSPASGRCKGIPLFVKSLGQLNFVTV